MVSHIRRNVDEGYETGLWNPASPHIVLILHQVVYFAGVDSSSLDSGMNDSAHDLDHGNAGRREDIGFASYDR
jgi:hypothetical protein